MAFVPASDKTSYFESNSIVFNLSNQDCCCKQDTATLSIKSDIAIINKDIRQK